MATHPFLVILTGAGISAESGIKTFRDAKGLWENHAIDEVASPQGFAKNPELVQRFYNQRRQQLFDLSINPNAAHLALAELEAKWGGPFLMVTQNVDNLHERAGSVNLRHMHGELARVRCVETGKPFEWLQDVREDSTCPCCEKTRTLRPDIVWFGEKPFHMEEITAALEHCELFVAIGTSGNVYPAAGFVREVPRGARTIEVNADRTMISSQFQEKQIGPASVEVPKLVKALLSGK